MLVAVLLAFVEQGVNPREVIAFHFITTLTPRTNYARQLLGERDSALSIERS